MHAWMESGMQEALKAWPEVYHPLVHAERRVFARVRPMSRAEQAARVPSPLKAADARTLLLAGGSSGAAVQKFTFDRVFAPSEVRSAERHGQPLQDTCPVQDAPPSDVLRLSNQQPVTVRGCSLAHMHMASE